MPKQVDHDERRREIADAVVRLAGKRGLAAVTFREVAAEAGISVALVQHYFGTKHNLLIRSVDIVSARMADLFSARFAALGPDASNIDRIRALAGAFVPTGEDSREVMVFYAAVGAVGLTDPEIRGAGAHRNFTALVNVIASLLDAARAAGEIGGDGDTAAEARVLASAISGMSSAVLLEAMSADDAFAAIEAYLRRMS